MYSLKTAAEAVGRGKPAILKAIQKGTISAKKNPLGEWEIDPSELHRVYPLISIGNTKERNSIERYETAGETLETDALKREIALLREQTEILKEERQDLRKRLDEETTDRRKSAEEVRRLTLLLTHRPEATEPPKKRVKWWNKKIF